MEGTGEFESTIFRNPAPHPQGVPPLHILPHFTAGDAQVAETLRKAKIVREQQLRFIGERTQATQPEQEREGGLVVVLKVGSEALRQFGDPEDLSLSPGKGSRDVASSLRPQGFQQNDGAPNPARKTPNTPYEPRFLQQPQGPPRRPLSASQTCEQPNQLRTAVRPALDSPPRT